MAAAAARHGIDIDESSCVPLGDDIVGVSGGGEVEEIIEVVALPRRAGAEVITNSFAGFSKRVSSVALQLRQAGMSKRWRSAKCRERIVTAEECLTVG